MQIKLFTIPIPDNELAVQELNKFLEGKKILKIDQQLLQTKKGDFFCFCIQYEEGISNTESRRESKFNDQYDQKRDAYMERYKLLSSVRDKMAAEDGVKPQQVFHDGHLSNFARYEEPLTEQVMMLTSNFGNGKMEKFGKRFLKMLQEELDKR